MEASSGNVSDNDSESSASRRPLTSALAHSVRFLPTDAAAMSTEDDEYRSETSSETSVRKRGTKRSHRITAGPTEHFDHADLSARLRSGIHDGEDYFDASLIGADVILCVSRSEGAIYRCAMESSDVETSLNNDPVCFYAHRFMLAASSEPFRAMLTGGMRESSQRKVELHGVSSTVVKQMLLFIYTGEVVLDLDNVLGLLIAAEMYELSALRDICHRFVRYHANQVFRNPQLVMLPEKLLLEVIEHDDLQIREVALMQSVVMWGEARVENSSSSLGDILQEAMQHIRFPTMTVSDLYGKVQPLVRQGTIHESLLTEALFHHLKWDISEDQPNRRKIPRAGAAALRKRKRVSFIQHVSFGDHGTRAPRT